MTAQTALISDIPMKTTAAQRSTAFPQNDTHHPHQATTSHREREEKGGSEESEDGDDEEGERAGNPGSDLGMPQREDQRGYDPHEAHSPKTSRSKKPSQHKRQKRKLQQPKRKTQTNRTQQSLMDIWSNTPMPARQPARPAAAKQLTTTSTARKATRDEDAPT